MTDENAAYTRIRSPALAWGSPAAAGAALLAVAALFSALLRREPLPEAFFVPWLLLVIGTAVVVEALWIRTWGIDLLPEHALVRGFRRRLVPWREVQAVVRHPQAGGWLVQLVLDNGKPVTLRAPMISAGFGGKRSAAAYERDYHRIGQWWLAHRGPSWREVTHTA
ncbi:hypothetical protein [Pengzhenrongella sp.]|jgi:protein-S-isoprenylcysteine O-methyltransferase Ste14|uniref:hypothetical protein n=1 Tax=Pengzhenrongella sp. TaxID=2888820 RepID=UPI002F93FA2E